MAHLKNHINQLQGSLLLLRLNLDWFLNIYRSENWIKVIKPKSQENCF